MAARVVRPSGFVNPSVGALQHLALGRRSTQQVQTNRVKCDVVDSKLRFNCVSSRHKVGQMVRLLLRLLQEARQCLARTFVCCERTIGYCPMRRCKETITSRRGISDATRASGTLTECIGCLLLIWI